MMRKTFAPLALMAGLALLAAACSNPQKTAREQIQRGDSQMAENKVADAVIQYRNAVRNDPMSGEARKKLGDAYLKTGNVKGALTELVRAADLLSSDIDAQIAAGKILLQTGQFEDAGGRAAKALALDPKNAEAHVLKANSSAMLKDLDTAVSELAEAISLDPERTGSYSNLGAVEAMRGRQAEAEAAFLKAIEVAPNAVDPRLAAANYYWNLGRMDEVQKNMDAALRIDPKHVAANRAMALFQIVTGHREAAETYLKAVVANTNDPQARLSLADYYVAQKRPDDAAPLLEELAKHKVSFAAATSRLAGIAYGRGERDKAHQMLDSILLKEPTNIQVLYVKGTWELAEKRPDDAFATAQAALKAAPDSVPAHQLAATVFLAQQRKDEAIDEFKEVLKLNPNVVVAQMQLARLNEAKGSADISADYARQAVKLAPQSGAARYLLVRSLIASGDVPGPNANSNR